MNATSALETLAQVGRLTISQAIPALRAQAALGYSEDGLAALESAAGQTADINACVRALLPAIGEALTVENTQAGACLSLVQAAKRGVQLSTVVSALADVVNAGETTHWAATALRYAAGQKADISGAANGLTRWLGAEDNAFAYHAAAALVALAIASGHASEKVPPLLQHDSHVVREGAVAGLAADSLLDVPERAALLALVLGDSASGVVRASLDALEAESVKQSDLGPATEALLSFEWPGKYSTDDDHWAFPNFPDRDHESDIHWTPELAAALVLGRHYINQSMWSPAETFMRRGTSQRLGVYLASMAYRRANDGDESLNELRQLSALYRELEAG